MRDESEHSDPALTPPGQTFYKIADLAERWQCSAGKVRTMIASGVLAFIRNGKMIRVPAAAVAEFEKPQRPQNKPSPPENPSVGDALAKNTAFENARFRAKMLRIGSKLRKT